MPYLMQKTDATFNYFTEPSTKYCLGYRNNSCYWPRGKMIGGSGAINAMVYVRGNKGDYDNWENLGNKDWGWDGVLPYFEKSRKLIDGAGLALNRYAETDSILDIVKKSAIELGNKEIPDFDGLNDIGYTETPSTQENGRRMSTGKTYLAKAKNRENLHVVKNASVKKINFSKDGKIAESVTFVYKDSKEFTVKARKEIISSAGAVDSPKLLLLSGIGPKEQLEHFGISVIKNLHVGKNLQDHSMIPVIFKIQENTAKSFDIKQRLGDLQNYLLHNKGPIGSLGLSLVGFVNTDIKSKSPYPDIGAYHLPIRRKDPFIDTFLNAFHFKEEIVEPIREAHERAHLLVVYLCVQRPTSVGEIKLKSANYKDEPKIVPNYLSTKYDRDVMLRGLKYQITFEKSQTFKENGGEFIKLNIPECNSLEFKSHSYLECFMKYMTTTIYHPIGTAKMGPDSDPTAVVDSTLKVKGIQNLRVIDASIMPFMVSANTNGPTIMIAEKGVDFIIKEWNKKDEL